MNEPKSYAIRLHPQAAADIDEAHERMAASQGNIYADAWQNGLRDTMATLATFPAKYPLAHENRLFQSVVHSCPYRAGSGATVYRLLYEIVADDDEAPHVHVLHIRHGARKPMTRAEARKIEAED